MGAGSSSAGAMPAGYDPLVTLAPYKPGGPPSAIKLDLRNKDAVLDADGKYEDMGTIEQQVALAFGYPRRSLKHKPEIGHDFLTLPRVHGAALDAEIDRRARIATPFDQLLADGLVELLGVEKRHPKTTETGIAILWRKTGEVGVRRELVGTG